MIGKGRWERGKRKRKDPARIKYKTMRFIIHKSCRDNDDVLQRFANDVVAIICISFMMIAVSTNMCVCLFVFLG